VASHDTNPVPPRAAEYEDLSTSPKKQSAKSVATRASVTLEVSQPMLSVQHVGNYLPNIGSGMHIQQSNQKSKLRNSMITSPGTTTTGVDKNS
jgi:hypothetical protein